MIQCIDPEVPLAKSPGNFNGVLEILAQRGDFDLPLPFFEATSHRLIIFQQTAPPAVARREIAAIKAQR